MYYIYMCNLDISIKLLFRLICNWSSCNAFCVRACVCKCVCKFVCKCVWHAYILASNQFCVRQNVKTIVPYAIFYVDFISMWHSVWYGYNICYLMLKDRQIVFGRFATSYTLIIHVTKDKPNISQKFNLNFQYVIKTLETTAHTSERMRKRRKKNNNKQQTQKRWKYSRNRKYVCI